LAKASPGSLKNPFPEQCAGIEEDAPYSPPRPKEKPAGVTGGLDRDGKRLGYEAFANPAELVAIITAARKGGNGTSGEQALLTAMRAIHLGAIAQVEIADAAIAVIAGCSNLANEAALATIGPSDGANPF
jgi:hypothetical protein